MFTNDILLICIFSDLQRAAANCGSQSTHLPLKFRGASQWAVGEVYQHFSLSRAMSPNVGGTRAKSPRIAVEAQSEAPATRGAEKGAGEWAILNPGGEPVTNLCLSMDGQQGAQSSVASHFN